MPTPEIINQIVACGNCHQHYEADQVWCRSCFYLNFDQQDYDLYLKLIGDMPKEKCVGYIPKPITAKVAELINSPEGVSQWRKTGIERGYWAYFEQEIKEKIIKIIKDMPTKFPKFENWDYDRGHQHAKKYLLNKLK